LSLKFQIQLEKIRASENEVRWQHEDDVDDCSNCKQTFHVTRRKVVRPLLLLFPSLIGGDTVFKDVYLSSVSVCLFVVGLLTG